MKFSSKKASPALETLMPSPGDGRGAGISTSPGSSAAFADIAAADEASVPANSAPPTPPAGTVDASIEADAAEEGSPATGENEVPEREVFGDFGELCDTADRGAKVREEREGGTRQSLNENAALPPQKEDRNPDAKKEKQKEKPPQ